MAAITTAAVGAAGALGGAYMSSQAQDRATDAALEASQFRPFDISGGGLGNLSFDGQSVNVSADPTMARLQEMFGADAIAQMMGQGGAAGIRDVQGVGAQAAGDLGRFYPGALQDMDAGLGHMAGGTQDYMSQIGMLGGQIPGIMQDFRSTASGPGVVDPSSQFALNTGAGMLSQGAGSVVDDTLARLRASARPQEERAVNSRVQQLFNRGTLSSTSGARAIGELGLAQEQADIGRQLTAEQAGLQRFQANQNAGQGLFSMGQSGLLQGRNLNQNLAQMGGAFGFQGVNTGANLAGGMLGARTDLGGAIQNRGMSRINLAQGLFGFGQDATTNVQNRATGSLNSILAGNADLRNLIALGGNIGGQQASAGATQANAILSNAGSPAGGFLSGAGTQLLESGLGKILEEQG